MFYLGVAYAANIGGTGTLTASEPNVIMKGILDEKFPCQVRNLNLEMFTPKCDQNVIMKEILDKQVPTNLNEHFFAHFILFEFLKL